MAKFKVGDIIRANEKSNNVYDFAKQENNWSGIVIEYDSKGYLIAKTLAPSELSGRIYSGLNEKRFDLDLVKNNQIQRHIVNKNAVVIILNDGQKGIAKCNPSDKFNLAFGTALAVARAYGDKETEAKLLAEPVKEKPKFKVGELVRIRQWDDMKKEFGTVGTSILCLPNFVKEMKPLCGKYAEIVRLDKDGRVDLKLFNCDGLYIGWHYSTGMIEKV